MPCSVQPQLAQPATVIQVQAQRGPSTTRGRDQHAEGPSLPAAGLAELCGRSDGQCRLQRSSSALPPSVFSCEPSAPLQQRVCSARCTVAEMKSSLSLRRGKTTAASGQEEKETEMDKEPFGGGLAAEDDQVTLEPWSKVSAAEPSTVRNHGKDRRHGPPPAVARLALVRCLPTASRLRGRGGCD